MTIVMEVELLNSLIGLDWRYVSNRPRGSPSFLNQFILSQLAIPLNRTSKFGSPFSVALDLNDVRLGYRYSFTSPLWPVHTERSRSPYSMGFQ